MIVKELIDLLRKCPENDLLMIDSGKELDADIDWDIEDVLVGTGVLKGFSYLKIVKENEPVNYNEPLTLDDLREMEGEPVWCEIRFKGKPPFYGIVHGENVTGFVPGDDKPVNLAITHVGAYGLAWLAYRHKPEEA